MAIFWHILAIFWHILGIFCDVFGQLFITRPLLNHYLLTREELAWRAAEVFGWAAAGELRWELERVFPLEQAAGAQLLLESGSTSGKILLSLE